MLCEFDSLSSTNKYCELLNLSQVEEFTIVWAHKQTDGIGQRGNRWESEPDANLTISIILKPTFLQAGDTFQLTQIIALGISDLLIKLLPSHDIRIKWPNDILADRKKICGTLITSTLNGAYIGSAICGIGLNVNQTLFPAWIPNPTSLTLLTRQNYVLLPLLNSLTASIDQRYSQFRDTGTTNLNEQYLQRLHGYRQYAHYQYKGAIIYAIIDNIDNYGRLLLTTDNGSKLCCQMKEITLLSTD